MPKPAVKPVIAVDIDDVLSNLAQKIVDFSNQKWGTNLTIDDYEEHWGEMWNVDDATTKQRSNEIHAAGLGHKLTHKPEAVPVLRKLAKKYSLVLVTSRRKLITRETKEWIDKFFNGIFTDIHHTGIYDSAHHADIQVQQTKTDILKDVGALYLIDDQPKHCLAAAEAGITALLFGDYPWSRDVKLPEGVIRAENWQKVLEYFNGQN
jgi:5'(3')-deoxyribonucleotidase